VIYVTRECGIVERWKNGDSDLGMMEFWKNGMVEFSFPCNPCAKQNRNADFYDYYDFYARIINKPKPLFLILILLLNLILLLLFFKNNFRSNHKKSVKSACYSLCQNLFHQNKLLEIRKRSITINSSSRKSCKINSAT